MIEYYCFIIIIIVGVDDLPSARVPLWRISQNARAVGQPGACQNGPVVVGPCFPPELLTVHRGETRLSGHIFMFETAFGCSLQSVFESSGNGDFVMETPFAPLESLRAIRSCMKGLCFDSF